jgi:signal transduction histidine kinase
LVRISGRSFHLLDNAVKFSPAETEIKGEVRQPDKKIVQIAVRDHGCGIPAEHREGIFGRFYQAHRDNRGGGMGLGLYVSSQIVALHGVTIEAQFPDDGGTRFVVTLPVG